MNINLCISLFKATHTGTGNYRRPALTADWIKDKVITEGSYKLLSNVREKFSNNELLVNSSKPSAGRLTICHDTAQKMASVGGGS